MRPSRLRTTSLGAALALALVGAACGGDDADPASVSIVAPVDGAAVSGPVDVSMAADGFVLEPAGMARDGAGHLHLIVNNGCVAPGEPIPSDETHLHYGDGATTAVLDLPPGEHTLCLQAGDGFHIALDLTDVVTFTVSE